MSNVRSSECDVSKHEVRYKHFVRYEHYVQCEHFVHTLAVELYTPAVAIKNGTLD